MRTHQKVLVVEDSKLHQRFIADILRNAEYDPVMVETAEEATAYCDIEIPLLIILDLGLPGISGLEFLKEIRQIINLPIIMLTNSDSIQDKLRGFELGADDYVTKPFNPQELLARIEAVLRRSSSKFAGEMQKTTYQSGPLKIDFYRKEVVLDNRVLHLTATEYMLLHELVINEGRVMPHDQLLMTVWGPEYLNERDILRTNIYRLRKKLQLEEDFQFIESQAGFGYWFEPFPQTR
ncbi:MAG: response regulator transcription factor [Anaerolineales bacterium]|nr:response regulator transcription factor [Anaerolineales bacterium]